MEFKVKSRNLAVSETAGLRTQALLTDPDAFGEQHGTATGRSHRDWADWLAERANGKDRELFALLHKEQYVGMCGVGIDRDTCRTGFIWGVYVRPEYRGRGGAELLLAAAHDWLLKKGICRVDAKVATPNDIAIKFYKRIGYTIIGQDGMLRDGSSIPVYAITMDLANKALLGTARKLAAREG